MRLLPRNETARIQGSYSNNNLLRMRTLSVSFGRSMEGVTCFSSAKIACVKCKRCVEAQNMQVCVLVCVRFVEDSFGAWQ